MTTSEELSVVTPADWIAGPEQGKWTYSRYAALSEDGRYEVVDGVLYMSPSPNVRHQEIIGEIFAFLRTFTRTTGLGKVYMAPLDVRLSSKDIVQPDVFVLLKGHVDRIKPTHIEGAPDLVVEIASPATAHHDLHKKVDTYACAGVPEYWVVNPDAQTIELFVLENQQYRSRGLFSGNKVLPSVVLPGFAVRVEEFFPVP